METLKKDNLFEPHTFSNTKKWKSNKGSIKEEIQRASVLNAELVFECHQYLVIWGKG